MRLSRWPGGWRCLPPNLMTLVWSSNSLRGKNQLSCKCPLITHMLWQSTCMHTYMDFKSFKMFSKPCQIMLYSSHAKVGPHIISVGTFSCKPPTDLLWISMHLSWSHNSMPLTMLLSHLEYLSLEIRPLLAKACYQLSFLYKNLNKPVTLFCSTSGTVL